MLLLLTYIYSNSDHPNQHILETITKEKIAWVQFFTNISNIYHEPKYYKTYVKHNHSLIHFPSWQGDWPADPRSFPNLSAMIYSEAGGNGKHIFQCDFLTHALGTHSQTPSSLHLNMTLRVKPLHYSEWLNADHLAIACMYFNDT